MILQRYKLVFAGSMGAGKSTAIQTISSIDVLSTEAINTDLNAHKKAQTTVGIDYGELILEDGNIVGLYGTPGQERFDFIWDIITEGALGVILLIDHTTENPIEQLNEYLTYYKIEYILRYSNKILNTYKDIIKKYINYFKKQIETQENTKYEETIIEFINSKYTLERFCINKGLKLNDFNSNRNGIFIKVMSNNKELYAKFLYCLELKNKDRDLNIANDIKKIMESIYILGKEFSLIDLFLLTNYGIRELINAADKILNIEDLKVFRKYIDICYRNFAIYGNFMNTQRINFLISSPYKFTLDNVLIETTTEDRENVINFLKNKEIPINSKIFEIAISRYYRNKERRIK